MLAHNVYFTLQDDSDEAQKRLVDACHKHLKDHPGIVFFAAGTLAKDLARPVNVRDFHVGLHIIFTNQAAHDAYQVHPSHERFVEDHKSNWKQVRVFDSLVTA